MRVQALVREWRRVVEEEERAGSNCVVVIPNTGNGNSNGHISPPDINTRPPPIITIACDKSTPPPSPPPTPLPHNNGTSSSSYRDPSRNSYNNNNNSISSSSNAAVGGGGGGRKTPSQPPSLARTLLSKVEDLPTPYRSGSRHGYAPLSPAAPRPGTAPASPALETLSSSRLNRARHSAPNSPAPAPPSNHHQNGSSYPSSPGQSSHLRHPPSDRDRSTSHASNPPNTSNAFTRTNVANKRLRKPDDEILELELASCEPPHKRHKGSHESVDEQPCKGDDANGVLDQDDNNSIGGSSSGSGYCEVIDSVTPQPTKSSATPPPNLLRNVIKQQHSSRASSSNSINNSNNFISNEEASNSNIANRHSSFRGGNRPPSGRKGPSVGSANLPPAASDGSKLPGASRGVSSRTNTPDSNHNSSSGNTVINIDDTVSHSRDIINSSNSGGRGAALPSSSRAGRGRGRRKSIVTSPAPPQLKLPTTKSKVKTTSQLVAELAQRKGDTLLAQRASKLEEQQKSHDEMTRNKMDHMIRYVRSLPSPPELSSVTLSPSPPPTIISPEPPVSDIQTTTLTSTTPEVPATTTIVPNANDDDTAPLGSVLDQLGVTEDDSESMILARLPPIDVAAAIAADELDEKLASQDHGHTGEDS